MTLGVLEVEVPIRIEPEMNRRDHGAARGRRFKKQKRAVFFALAATASLRARRRELADSLEGDGILIVTLTRIGPRVLDDDNLASGFKAVRDQVASTLGVNDNDGRVLWRYAQRKGKPREFMAIVRIEEGGGEA